MAGILDLIANAENKKRQRDAEKQRENYEGLLVSLAGLSNPSLKDYVANSIQDADYYMEQLVGPGYKEHQPFVLNALHGVGNAVLGAFGGQLPQKHAPQIPVLPAQGFAQRPEDQQAPDTTQQAPDTTVPQDALTLLTKPWLGPATFAQGAPAQVAQVAETQQPLPGGTTPPSILAAASPTGVSPGTLVGEGVPVGKGPNAPKLMPLPREWIREGQLDVIAQRGQFGKIPQQTQQIINDAHKALAQGRMTLDEAKEMIRKAVMADVDPTRSAAMGTDVNTYIKFPARPAHKDPVTGEDIPEQKERTEKYQRNSRTGELVYHGKPVSWASIEAQGGVEVDRPPGEQRINRTVRGDHPLIAQEFAKHPEWGKPVPEYSYQVTFGFDPSNPDDLKMIGPPTPLGSATAGRDVLSRNIRMAQNIYRQANGQPLSAAQAATVGSLMTQREEAVRLALMQQRMGATQTVYGVAPGQGLLLTPQEAQQYGVVQTPGAAIAPYLTNPTEQNLPPPEGQPGVGAPGATAPNPALVMQGLDTTAPAPLPAAVPPALPAATTLTPGEQPPAAGFPAAAPAAAKPPAPPPMPAPVRQPAPAAPGGVIRLRPPETINIAQAGPQYGPLGVPIKPPEEQRRDDLNAFMSSISGQPNYNRYAAARGARLIEDDQHISPGDLNIASAQWTGTNKSIEDVRQKSAAMGRFVDQLDIFTDAWLDVLRKVPDAGSILGNALQRDVWNLIDTDPRLAAARASSLPMKRAWAAIASNAYLSTGQLPVESMRATSDVFSNDNTPFKNAVAIAQRMKVEGRGEKYSFDLQEWRARRDQANNPIGKATGTKVPDMPPRPAELGPRPKDQQLAKGPNGIWYRYSAATDTWDPDPKLNKKK